MARIRTIKPEFWTSEQIADCSPTARLLFIGLWTFCDDAGRHPASTKRLKMEIFPADPFTDLELSGWVAELESAGLVTRYEAQGKEYWQVTGWYHQKIEKPTIKYPAPEFGDHSATIRRPLTDPSPPESKGYRYSSDQFDQAELKSDALLVETCQRLLDSAGLSTPTDFDWRVSWLHATKHLAGPGVAMDAYRGAAATKAKKPRGVIRTALRNAHDHGKHSDPHGEFERLFQLVPNRKWPEWSNGHTAAGAELAERMAADA